jgi:large subunit ribosomal protein L9
VTVNVARSADEAERQARGEEVLTRDVDTFEREVGPITDEDGYGED